MYRIRYWLQDTQESGHWELTEAMSLRSANVQAASTIYGVAYVEPDEEYAVCGNCVFVRGNRCSLRGSGKSPAKIELARISPEGDTCVEWKDKHECLAPVCDCDDYCKHDDPHSTPKLGDA